MIRVLTLMLVTFPVFAVQVIQGQSETITCQPPSTYTNGDIIENDPLMFTFYQNGVQGTTESVCSLTIDTTGMTGEYIYTVTAESTLYGTVSVQSNPNTVNVIVPKSPNAPSWE